MRHHILGALLLSSTINALGNATGNGMSLVVDLGYSVYQGYHNDSNNLNIWNSIRYAAPPVGDLRFQAPQPPLKEPNMQLADKVPPQCPQGDPSDAEDCLFLSVYSPPNAKNLPVLLWIHGGGYFIGGIASYDLNYLMSTREAPFVAVAIQYRLGPLGFLASDEVKNKGALNCGLLDQRAAMNWVQRYINLFGGDPDRVTIAGESAGGGSVMLHAITGRGSYGTSLFRQIWAASPYLPFQYGYSDAVTANIYHDLITKVGCATSEDTFKCLAKVPFPKLINASLEMRGPGYLGIDSLFNPVTDGEYLQTLPSEQLTQGPVNGARILTGNNANEGMIFVPPNITTNAEFDAYVGQLLPLFNKNGLEKLKLYYPPSLNDSAVGAGPLERLRRLVADISFDCPSLWLAEAFSESYKYQFSVPPAFHAQDVGAYFTSQSPVHPAFTPTTVREAMREMIFSFVTTGNPTIRNTTFPAFSPENRQMLNFNATGPSYIAKGLALSANQPVRILDVNSKSNITILNAYDIDVGRGPRCDFLRSYGRYLPA